MKSAMMTLLLLATTTDETNGTPGLDIAAAMVIVGGVVALAVLIAVATRGKVARRQADRPTAREMIEEIKARAEGGRGRSGRVPESSRDAEDLDIGRRLASQLDNKAERLEILLDEARREIDRLESILRSAAGPDPARHDPPPETPPESSSDSPWRSAALDLVDKNDADLDESDDVDSDIRTPAHEVESTPRLSHGAPQLEPEVELDPLTRSVYALADDGRSSVEIARKLDEQIGKVELILALRPRG